MEQAPQSTDGGSTRGRPVLGAIAGLLFGIALAVDFLMTGVIGLSSVWVLILPVLFLAIGTALGIWSPLAYLRRPGGGAA